MNSNKEIIKLKEQLKKAEYALRECSAVGNSSDQGRLGKVQEIVIEYFKDKKKSK